MTQFKTEVFTYRLVILLLLVVASSEGAVKRDYYYTRTRSHPDHLRISEVLKNNYVDDVRLESVINGTKFEYYHSSLAMNYDELVFETIDRMFRHRLSPFYIHHYEREQDKRRSADPVRASPEACARDLLYLVDKLPLARENPLDAEQHEEPLTPELAAFFDSYARPEAGLLMGNTYWVGAYDQCIKRQIFELIDVSQQQQRHQSSSRDEHQQAVAFNGRYCVASLRAPSWNRLIEAKKISSKNYFKTEHQMRDYAQLFRLQVGICLPDSCDSTALERHRDELKLLTASQLSSGQSESRFSKYELIDLYCLPDEQSPLRQWSTSAINFWLFIGFWLTMVTLATLADLFGIFPVAPAEMKGAKVEPTGTAGELEKPPKKTRRSRLPQLVQCFSLRANYRKLMHVDQAETGAKSSEQPDTKSENHKQLAQTAQQQSQQEERRQPNLRFLNALKVLIMFWIINGHIMLLMIQTAKNILNSDALLNELMHFLIGATFGVDLFFTITGFLTAYLIFSGGHAHKMRPTTWIYLSFHRYWRLAPMYLLSFWFSRSVMQSLGSGPLWDYGSSSITFRGLCNTESWWYPLTLTSNLHGLFEECMITSWYIACDMQFWLVSPIFIQLLARSPAQGWIVSLLTIAASTKARCDAILSDKSARYDELVQPRADIFMRVSHDLPALYTHPHYRIASYLIGMLAGHYVYLVSNSSIGKQKKTEYGIVNNDNQDRENLPNMTTTNNPTTHETDYQNQQEPIKTTMREQEKTTSSSLRPPTKRVRALLAYVGLALFILMAFISYLLHHYYPASWLKQARLVAALAYSIDHLLMSASASAVIVAICLGQWPRLERFLDHPNWTRISKLNYALLLLQCEAIYYQIFRYDQVPMAGTKELINILFNLVVTLYPLALAATLVFEFPLANLEKLM